MVVAHVNHGLRENAKIDEEYVKKYCEEYKIEIYIKHADVGEIANKNKAGLEETGRVVRYEFFDEVMQIQIKLQ